MVKNFDVATYGVVELSESEMMSVNGGIHWNEELGCYEFDEVVVIGFAPYKCQAVSVAVGYGYGCNGLM